jgi:hypothetical protein
MPDCIDDHIINIYISPGVNKETGFVGIGLGERPRRLELGEVHGYRSDAGEQVMTSAGC